MEDEELLEESGVPLCSACAASLTDGILIWLPRITLLFSERPFAAASARVVKLLAAAMDQRVSPGWTV